MSEFRILRFILLFFKVILGFCNLQPDPSARPSLRTSIRDPDMSRNTGSSQCIHKGQISSSPVDLRLPRGSTAVRKQQKNVLHSVSESESYLMLILRVIFAARTWSAVESWQL